MKMFAITFLLSKTKEIDEFTKFYAFMKSHSGGPKVFFDFGFRVFIDVTTTLAPRFIDLAP